MKPLPLFLTYFLLCYTWAQQDTIKIVGDTLQKDTSVTSPLDAPVYYKAADSIVFFLDSQQVYLFNQGQLQYKDLQLESGYIFIDLRRNLIEASGVWDTAGDSLAQTPVFKDAQETYYAQGMRYNMKTRRGIIFNGRTQQGTDFIYGQRVKRMPQGFFFVQKGQFTTCDANPPHYYIRATKLKVIPGKQVISGPLYMVIADVPIPLILPFGYFPQAQGRTSGFIFPTFGESAQRGFFARGLGYYWGKSEYFDLLLDADLFTLGGYRAGARLRYKRRYRYDGTLSLQYSLQRYNEPDDPDYQENRNFFVQWQHQQQINPKTRFNANVNAGTSSFLRLNSYQEQDYLTTQLQSSITLHHSFYRSPWYFTLGATHAQQLRTRDLSITFPSFFLSRSRMYPFKGKVTKNRWYERIGITYALNAQNQLSIKDTNLFRSRIQDSMRYGIRHQIQIAANWKLFRYFSLAPSLSMREYWYPWEIEKFYLQQDSLWVLTTKRIYRLTAVRDFQWNVPLSTRIFGIWQSKSKRRWALRHVMTPSIGWQYKPDFSKPNFQVFREVIHPTTQQKLLYSKVEQGIFGGPSAGEIQAITFQILNQYEIKYLKRVFVDSDSMPPNPKDRYKYQRLLDNLSVSTSYNFAADSLRLSPLQFNARTLIQGIFNLNVDATLHPYALADSGDYPINRLEWEVHRRIGRWTAFNFTLGAPIHQLFPQKSEKNNRYRFPYQWNLQFNFVYTYSKPARTIVQTRSLRFNGTLQPSRYWKISFSSGYDFDQEQFTFTTFNIHRDLHCWELIMTVVPFGIRRSYFLTIQVKAPSLRDLKITKRRDWQDRIQAF